MRAVLQRQRCRKRCDRALPRTIRGYQGEGLADPMAVLARAKHLVGYSETQGGRDASEADLTPRKLRAWFLPPFERAARAGCRTFMLGYQSIDGTPITANEWLLSDVIVAMVLLASKTQVLPPAAMGAVAIINAFNPRMRGGQALAELIFGLIEPSGRLPLTFARHAGHLPLFCNRLNGQHGHRYADLTQEPRSAFGEGLSFTTVEPAELELLQRECHQGDTVRTRITLRTNGRRLALGWPPPPMGIPMRCGGHPIASRSDGA
jgi:hypothetical protein